MCAPHAHRATRPGTRACPQSRPAPAANTVPCDGSPNVTSTHAPEHATRSRARKSKEATASPGGQASLSHTCLMLVTHRCKGRRQLKQRRRLDRKDQDRHKDTSSTLTKVLQYMQPPATTWCRHTCTQRITQRSSCVRALPKIKQHLLLFKARLVCVLARPLVRNARVVVSDQGLWMWQ